MPSIIPLPAFEDNYIWVLRGSQHAAVVDPGDEDPVLEYLEREGLKLCAILATHHHGDHVGGVRDIVARHPVPVYGPRAENIPVVSHPLSEGDRITLPELDLAFDVLEIPGHTRGHIGYYTPGHLFCGDTLFACGCGRLFEGTAAQMVDSLSKLARLPADTRVYCAHEYTLANIRFARTVEPGNASLAEREKTDRRTREESRPTLPSTIGLELATNPFLRWREPEVVRAAQERGADPADQVSVFAAIREWKNRF